MKPIKFVYFFIICISVIILSGCTTVQTLYLQDVEVNGPINQFPVHLTDSTETPSVTISMRFSYNPEKEIKAKSEGTPMVNSEGVYQVDTIYNSNGTITYKKSNESRYQYRGQNLTWSITTVFAN